MKNQIKALINLFALYIVFIAALIFVFTIERIPLYIQIMMSLVIYMGTYLLDNLIISINYNNYHHEYS